MSRSGIGSRLREEDGLRRLISGYRFSAKREQYIRQEEQGNGGDAGFAHVTLFLAANAGDTALSQCVRRTLMTSVKVRNWELIPVRKPVTDEVIGSINRCKKLIIGGGGLFLADTNENAVSGWQWAVPEEALDQITAKICVYSVGYNYFPGQEPNELFIRSVRSLAEKSAFFGLRNRGSIEAVKALVAPGTQEKIVFQPCTTTLIRRLFPDLPVKKDTGNVAFNMAFDREDRRYGANRGIILDQVALAAKKIEEKGYRIHCVCHCKDDDRFTPYLKRCGVHYKLTDLSRQYPDRVYDFYNRMDMVLGMRGHAQMIPFGLNCGIISLGTHNKLRWFLEDINATDWYVDLNREPEKLADRIFERFVTIHETDRAETGRRLIEAQDLLWEITCRNLERISRI